jgi:hypothetical protein
MLSDRMAIAKNWPYAPALSVQYVLDCLAEHDICPAGAFKSVVLALLTRPPAPSKDLQWYEINKKFGGGTCTALCYPFTSGGSLELQHANKVLGWSNLILFWITVASLITVIITRSISYQPIWPIILVLLSSLLLMTSILVSFILLVPLSIQSSIATRFKIDTRQKCNQTCRDGSQPEIVGFDHFAPITQATWSLQDKILAIKSELFQRGPVVASIDSSGLPGRTFGVYSHHSTDRPDHAVGVVGWGESYWIMRNSWGEDAGDLFDKGYYKIEFGSCKIEDDVWAGFVE